MTTACLALLAPVLFAADPTPDAQKRLLAERDRLALDVNALRGEGRSEEASRAARRIDAITVEALGPRHPDRVAPLTAVAELSEGLGDFPAAVAARGTIRDVVTAADGAAHWHTTDARLALDRTKALAKFTAAQRKALAEADRLGGVFRQAARRGTVRGGDRHRPEGHHASAGGVGGRRPAGCLRPAQPGRSPPGPRRVHGRPRGTVRRGRRGPAAVRSGPPDHGRRPVQLGYAFGRTRRLSRRPDALRAGIGRPREGPGTGPCRYGRGAEHSRGISPVDGRPASGSRVLPGGPRTPPADPRPQARGHRVQLAQLG